MTTPISLDIPHSLGKAQARARLDGGIGKLGTMMPGGGTVSHDWDGDTMRFTVAAMGQTMRCTAEVFDAKVHAIVDLPPFLSLFAGRIREALGKGLPRLLN